VFGVRKADVFKYEFKLFAVLNFDLNLSELVVAPHLQYASAPERAARQGTRAEAWHCSGHVHAAVTVTRTTGSAQCRYFTQLQERDADLQPARD
jgi:hypothetical protein